jgi:hypothetical protein
MIFIRRKPPASVSLQIGDGTPLRKTLQKPRAIAMIAFADSYYGFIPSTDLIGTAAAQTL